MRKIVISDIHGHRKTFEKLLEQIEFSSSDELFLLGDYIDRGPDSKGVLDKIMSLQEQGFKVNCLQGNHELLMINARDKTPDSDYIWMRNGGEATLESFGLKKLGDIPEKYWQFLESLPLIFEEDNYIMVHAGLDFNLENPLEDKKALLWIRDWYPEIDYKWLGDRYIIHGHTTTPRTIIEKMYEHLDSFRVLNIDGGCYRTSRIDFGYLCAFDLSNRLLYFQENIG